MTNTEISPILNDDGYHATETQPELFRTGLAGASHLVFLQRARTPCVDRAPASSPPTSGLVPSAPSNTELGQFSKTSTFLERTHPKADDPKVFLKNTALSLLVPVT